MRYFDDGTHKAHSSVQNKSCGPKTQLTEEQNKVLEELEKGNSVVVDSCIGSGKTLVIQEVSNTFSHKRVLYLTYNKLLKLDAQARIVNKNTTVQNYHGFVYSYLVKRGLSCPPDKQIKTFLERCSDVPLIYDIVCIDEYQDLEEDTVNLLLHIKKECPNAQWVFVGDMEQKIYDKTRINVYTDCIDKICPNYSLVQFTKCFRISSDHANRLGNIWEKKIEGINNNCTVSYTTQFEDVLNLVDLYENKDVLILGPRYGLAPEIVNILERRNPTKYNKSNVWTSIRDRDENTKIEPDSLIVTTYDGCKGMERKVCVVIDWCDGHYSTRAEKPFADKNIITNLFCVAASRGKDHILFYRDPGKPSEHFFCKQDLAEGHIQSLPDYNPSTMFEFKFQSDLEKCMQFLTVEQVPQDNQEIIKTKSRDKNIDLTPCVGMYQEISFFKNYNFEVEMDQYDNTPVNSRIKIVARKEGSLTPEQKSLILTALSTQLFRYVSQASEKFIEEADEHKLYERMKTYLDPDSKRIQVGCHIVSKFTAIGRIDYVDKSNIPWELKFAQRCGSSNFLQAAMYSIMYGSPFTYLWNTRTNDLYKISVTDKGKFLEQVYDTITMGRRLKRY